MHGHVYSRRGRASLGFTVTDYTDGDEVGLVHDSTESNGESVSELTTLVDGSGGLSVDVTVVVGSGRRGANEDNR